METELPGNLFLYSYNDFQDWSAADNRLLIKQDYQLYIGINGSWNMVLVKTPEAEDLGGRFAKSNLLLPFYGEPETKIEDAPIEQQ